MCYDVRDVLWEPNFASNLTLNLRLLIWPNCPGHSTYNTAFLIKDVENDLEYHNKNVCERQGLKNGEIMILIILRSILYDYHATGKTWQCDMNYYHVLF